MLFSRHSDKAYVRLETLNLQYPSFVGFEMANDEICTPLLCYAQLIQDVCNFPSSTP